MAEPESFVGKLHRNRQALGYMALLAALLVFSIQSGWINAGEISGILIDILSFVFLISALTSMYFTLFYAPKPDKQALAASNTPEANEFWAEAKKRRNLFLLTWVGWLVVGFPLWWLYSLVIPSDDPMAPGLAALGTWFAFWIWTAWRVSSMKCFNCGGKAFDSVFILSKRSRCKTCGIPFHQAKEQVE